MNEAQFIVASEIAKRTGLTEYAVHKAMRREKIQAQRAGPKWRGMGGPKTLLYSRAKANAWIEKYKASTAHLRPAEPDAVISTSEIRKRANISHPTVLDWLARAGIKGKLAESNYPGRYVPNAILYPRAAVEAMLAPRSESAAPAPVRSQPEPRPTPSKPAASSRNECDPVEKRWREISTQILAKREERRRIDVEIKSMESEESVLRGALHLVGVDVTSSPDEGAP